VKTPLVLPVVCLAVLAAAPAAAGYGWPIAPFREPHPVRGTFGEPRTVYTHPSAFQPQLEREQPEGAFAFHDGIDIAAAAGTPVYPVVSGRVSSVRGRRVIVATADGRSFH
jgi:murein DD-endopeptidase MepM/ murein hydrolase activator NlpD